MRSREVGILNESSARIFCPKTEKVDKLGNQGKLYHGSTIHLGMIIEFIWKQLLLHTHHTTVMHRRQGEENSQLPPNSPAPWTLT